jgi:GT2 family glycosyltransferase
MKKTDPYDLILFKSLFLNPKRIVESAWLRHIPFAFFLVELLKPKILVELGVHMGASFSSLCQAVKHFSTKTSCYGIDTFKGDEHASFYDESVYIDINDHITKEYGEFASLMKMTFDEGLDYFSDNSIDLLHIDGLHTYKAVKQDFSNWLPKMSDKGVVVFHDTQVRKDKFGVWKLWREVSKKYPSYEFRFGYGLGIIAVGKKVDEKFLTFLRLAKKREEYFKLFSVLGDNIQKDHINRLLEQNISELNNIISFREKENGELEAAFKNLESILKERDKELKKSGAHVKHLEEGIEQRDSVLKQRNKEIKKGGAYIKDLEESVKQRDSVLKQRNEEIKKGGAYIKDLEESIGQRDTALQGKDKHILHLEDSIGQRDTALKEKDRHILHLEDSIGQRDTALKDKDKQLKESDVLLNEQSEQLINKDTHINNLDAVIHQKDLELNNKNEQLKYKAGLEAKLNNIYNSHGWKLLLMYYKTRDWFLPDGSHRRRLAKIIISVLLSPVSFLRLISVKRLKRFLHLSKTLNLSELEDNVLKKLNTDTHDDDVPETSIEIKVDAIKHVDDIEELCFEKVKNPRVSIVIPIWNKWQYTYNCLNSLLENGSSVSYEVIVVDNASTDETPKMLKKVNNIMVSTNKKNEGFVKACNIGASKARGKYVLFLNNDTQVTKGWLSSMVSLAENDKKVGAVGAKLIFQDGRLQEAGGIVWNDSKHIAWNYGRSNDPQNYEHNYVKEVDYSSGACLLVKKDLFDKVGGFSMEYAPAYCEDADLAFSLRKLGYKMMYQPKAEIIHFEGITAGTDTSQGMKQYQLINQAKFFEKWKSTLKKENFQNGKNVFLARDRARGKKVLLFVDHYVPNYDKDAGSMTTYMYLKLFVELGYKIVFVPDNFNKQEPYTSVLQQMGIEVLYGVLNFDKWLKENGKYIDFVWLSRPHISIKYIKKLQKHTDAKLLYYTHDLHYLREMRRYEIEKDDSILKEAKKIKGVEFQIFENVDTIITPSDKEVEIIKSEFKDKEVINIPVFFYDDIPDKRRNGSSFEKRSDLIFLGGFQHIPNVDAVEYLINDIFPIIKGKIPGIKLYIVGSNIPESLMKYHSNEIIFTGYVEDLTECFRASRIFVAPLRYGAGVKGKIITSMKYGVPVVTTSVGNEGIHLIDGQHCMISDDPKEFALNVVNLYNNKRLWGKLAKNSVEFLSNNFSKTAARRCMAKILKK